MQNKYNPDVLSCLANLSNDEVFTPPTIANQMLDMLPADLWSNPDAKFLDPCCKSGVFLREIAKRLIDGLAKKIPNLQERLNHIYSKQLYGIAITELTSMLSRRSVYCSKFANGKYSICNEFKTEKGNIVFDRTEHTWENGKCKFCGASQAEYDRDKALETHAYQFIHTDEVFKMKFDVIIGNPPYQLTTGTSSAQAIPIYNKFVIQAKKLNPRYLTMIIPSRWFTGGMGLDSFRDEMLHDTRLRKIVDFPVSTDCFTGVDIQGGVCYFLWDKDTHGDCEITTIRGTTISESIRPLLEEDCSILIRYNEAIPILRKVKKLHEQSFADLVSSQRPFGLPTNYRGQDKTFDKAVTVFVTKAEQFMKRTDVLVNQQWIDKYKVLMTKAYGMGDFPHPILNQPILAGPNSCCSETYVVLGTYDTEKEAKNVISYVNTKFFRFLVMLVKHTQDALKRVYQFVPMQDFSETWTDEKLYKKYKLTKDEIAFIDSMIRFVE